jgi:hypothetical protein
VNKSNKPFRKRKLLTILADGLMLRRELLDPMNGGLWIVLAMVFVMIGGLVGYMVATFTDSLVWAIPSGIASGLLAAGVVVWVSSREV